MTRLSNSLPILALMAGLLSACNSAGSVYPQGPWGVHDRRDYPRYLAPWGGRINGPVGQRLIAGSTDIMTPGGTEPHRPWTGRRIIRGEASLPDDPLPLRAGPGVDPLPNVAAATAPLESASSLPLARTPAPPSEASPPGVFQKPKHASSYAGQWIAADAKGASCKVQLSSVPALDLYKASTSGCSDESLRSVNAWSLREDNVILFSRGNAIARLSGEEASLNGVLNGSGGPLKMSR